jgi:hypothetical protein
LHVFIPAMIQIRDGMPLQSCTVLDVSPQGGRIRVETGVSIPNNFVLLFTKSGSVRRDCRVVWRQNGYLGVEFHSSFDLF